MEYAHAEDTRNWSNNMNGLKIVDFSHCKDCIHKNVKEDEKPCHECLNEPVILYSVKQINYKSKSEE